MPDSSPPPTGRHLYLPELPRLIPVAYHANAVQLETASNNWVRRFLGDCFAGEEELLRFLRQRNGLYGPLTVPEGEPAKVLCVSDWYQLVNAIEAIGAGSLLGGVVAGVKDGAGAGQPGSAYLDAARDLFGRIVVGLSQAQRQRLDQGLAALHAEVVSPVPALPSTDVPDLDTCLDRRAARMRYRVLGLLTEFAAEVDMTPFIGAHEFQQLHAHACRQMIIVSDLLSYRTAQRKTTPMNAVRLLNERDGLPLQDAVDRLCALVEHHERAYIAARSRILASPLGNHPDTRVYLVGMDHLVAGSQEFAYITPRHFGDGAVWDGTRSGWYSVDEPVTRLHGTDDHS
ncbi:hypothetical protein Daura_20995 [Dactylosporangium aurantiacum]|uniref:Terpene synthase n=1 Tax=Dactylosporangium aurantiacum TaxID=35754 RepID=A0A9Q9MGM0_9ACTN|nr:terpene synthase family protein [Dactylosporangium aurantiacum]MDG6110109.1 terpene synthase family protein [Dactylosporangium aurantiacum]UWZ58433.1 hypothetical protein Daura_20995 [Dactylosporangium aurantiacum]